MSSTEFAQESEKMSLLDVVKSLTLGRRRRERVSLWGTRVPHLSSSLLGTQGTYTSLHGSVAASQGGGEEFLFNGGSCNHDAVCNTLPCRRRQPNDALATSKEFLRTESLSVSKSNQASDSSSNGAHEPSGTFNTFPRAIKSLSMINNDTTETTRTINSNGCPSETVSEVHSTVEFISFEPLTGNVTSSATHLNDSSASVIALCEHKPCENNETCNVDNAASNSDHIGYTTDSFTCRNDRAEFFTPSQINCSSQKTETSIYDKDDKDIPTNTLTSSCETICSTRISVASSNEHYDNSTNNTIVDAACGAYSPVKCRGGASFADIKEKLTGVVWVRGRNTTSTTNKNCSNNSNSLCRTRSRSRGAKSRKNSGYSRRFGSNSETMQKEESDGSDDQNNDQLAPAQQQQQSLTKGTVGDHTAFNTPLNPETKSEDDNLTNNESSIVTTGHEKQSPIDCSRSRLTSRDIINDKQHSISSLQSSLKKFGATINSPLLNSFIKVHSKSNIKDDKLKKQDCIAINQPILDQDCISYSQYEDRDIPLKDYVTNNVQVVRTREENPIDTSLTLISKSSLCALDDSNSPEDMNGRTSTARINSNNKLITNADDCHSLIANSSTDLTTETNFVSVSSVPNGLSIDHTQDLTIVEKRDCTSLYPEITSNDENENHHNFICYSTTTLKPEMGTVVSLPISSSTSSLSSNISAGSSQHLNERDTEFVIINSDAATLISKDNDLKINLCSLHHSKPLGYHRDPNQEQNEFSSERNAASKVSNITARFVSDSQNDNLPCTKRQSFRSDMITFKRRVSNQTPEFMQRSLSIGNSSSCNKSIQYNMNPSVENISPILRNKLTLAGVSKIHNSDISTNVNNSRTIRKRSIICDDKELVIGDVPSCVFDLQEDVTHSDNCGDSVPIAVFDNPLIQSKNRHIPHNHLEEIRRKILYRKPSSVSGRNVRRVNSVLSRDTPRLNIFGTSIRRAKSFKESNEKDWDVPDDTAEESVLSDRGTNYSSNQSLSCQSEEVSTSIDEIGDDDNEYQDCGDYNLSSVNDISSENDTNWQDKLNSHSDITLVKWVIKVDNNSIEEDEEEFYYDSLDDYYDDFDKYYQESKRLQTPTTEEMQFMDEAESVKDMTNGSIKPKDLSVTSESTNDTADIQKLKVKLFDTNWRTNGEKLVSKLINNIDISRNEEQTSRIGVDVKEKKKKGKKSKRDATSKKEHKSKSSKKKDNRLENVSEQITDHKRKGKFAISLESKFHQEIDQSNGQPEATTNCAISMPDHFENGIVSELQELYEYPEQRSSKSSTKRKEKYKYSQDSHSLNYDSIYQPNCTAPGGRAEGLLRTLKTDSKDDEDSIDKLEMFFSGPIPDDDGNEYDDYTYQYPKISSHHRRSNVVFDGTDNVGNSEQKSKRKGHHHHRRYSHQDISYDKQYYDPQYSPTPTNVPDYRRSLQFDPSNNCSQYYSVDQFNSTGDSDNNISNEVADQGDAAWGEVAAQMDDVWDSIGLMDDDRTTVKSNG